MWGRRLESLHFPRRPRLGGVCGSRGTLPALSRPSHPTRPSLSSLPHGPSQDRHLRGARGGFSATVPLCRGAAGFGLAELGLRQRGGAEAAAALRLSRCVTPGSPELALWASVVSGRKRGSGRVRENLLGNTQKLPDVRAATPQLPPWSGEPSADAAAARGRRGRMTAAPVRGCPVSPPPSGILL